MSWKSVEMQVALPRTQDAGKLQDLLQQQGRLAQEQLSHMAAVEESQKRKRILEQQASEQLKNGKKEKGMGIHMETGDHEKESSMEQETVQHPFLGNKIDFSG
ncbi:hypothetical protein SAMN04487944_101126 [Gracilibacillus ureilyticus]|uniref:Uncharacterized protein n=1 Tax=Gracilibacillus ureilyticus TaxID=531814 RepID=A0A1H9L6H4_9BACI|nr:hypothetical protein [Gracilibacillus ureilyticus]SER07082.1 hypothetical protein SAMN04487944_101126 [Gracilibacillus ureilyticus]